MDNFSKFITEVVTTCQIKDDFVGYCIGLSQLQATLTTNKTQSYCSANHDKSECEEVTEGIMFQIVDRLNAFRTKYKRDKTISDHPRYVAAIPRAIGTRWDSKFDPLTHLASPARVQSICQYVSIVSTIKSLFMQPEFVTLFLATNTAHQCRDGSFERICCGDRIKQNPFFGEIQNVVMIQIFTDDFEVCSPLLIHAGTHKTCAYYMRILNMPDKYLSRLENIYLVCLSNSRDVKNGHTEIQELIVEDLRVLERDGIKVKCPSGDEITIKGALVCFSSDNLGANTAFGFIECFSNGHFCRLCDMKKSECDISTHEQSERLRTLRDYERCLQYVQRCDGKIDYGEFE